MDSLSGLFAGLGHIPVNKIQAHLWSGGIGDESSITIPSGTALIFIQTHDPTYNSYLVSPGKSTGTHIIYSKSSLQDSTTHNDVANIEIFISTTKVSFGGYGGTVSGANRYTINVIFILQ